MRGGDGGFRAMILAAGLGTRLRPLTNSRPKVLVPVQNRPLVCWLLEYLHNAGAEAVVLNGYHQGGMLQSYLRAKDFGLEVEVRLEPRLLGTAGGIRNVADFFDRRPFVVINGDILTNLGLADVLAAHRANKALATLVLVDAPLFNRVQVDQGGMIKGFQGGREHSLAYAGIQVMEPCLLEELPAGPEVSIIDVYEGLIRRGEKIYGYRAGKVYWRELGTVDLYRELHLELFRMTKAPIPGMQVGRQVVASDVEIGANVRLEQMVCIGAGCQIGDGAVIRGSILWERVAVAPGSRLQDCVVADGARVEDGGRELVLA